jgi:CheY-like chemotaxis protein
VAPRYAAKERSGRGSLLLAGKSILIVEDEPLIALDVHSALSAAGASIIAASAAAEAIRLIGYAEVSAAIVDVQLGRENAAGVCEVLTQRQIPFAFYTGRAEQTLLLAEWPDIQVLRKPGTAEGIVTLIASLLGLRRSPP